VTPSLLPVLYEFDFFARSDEVWENLLNFKILEVEPSEAAMVLNSLTINEVTSRVDSISLWNDGRNGFYCQLFLELWLYESTSQSFQYNNRFVSLWLNITA